LELYKQKKEAYLLLEFDTGQDAQVDLGEALVEQVKVQLLTQLWIE